MYKDCSLTSRKSSPRMSLLFEKSGNVLSLERYSAMNNVFAKSRSRSNHDGAHTSEAPSHYYKTNTTDCRHVGVVQRTRNGVKLIPSSWSRILPWDNH